MDGILEIIKYANKNIVNGDNIYGIYGGLHLGPYGYSLKNSDEVIDKLKSLKIPKIAANHCTGECAIEKMLLAKMNLVKGRKTNRITDGDSFTF